jgi:cytidylate kinase
MSSYSTQLIGKGTTVSQLSQKLTALGKHVVTWSNGNVFRAVTLLATTLAEEQQAPLESVLTKDQLANFMEQISFTDKHDILIEGVGLVSEVQNTLLKSPIVSKSIPTVAQVTQGEVIVFCQQALQTLVDAGSVVLLEGRAQTVNYMSTPHRFELVLSDDKIIGQRRAAQRIMGKGIQLLEEGASEEQVQTTLDQVLHDFVMEIPKE